MFLNRRHRVAGVDHLRKDDQFSACSFGPRRKIANLGKIRLEIAGRAGDLGSGDFHDVLSLLAQTFVQRTDSACLRPERRDAKHHQNCPDPSRDNRNHRTK